MGNILRSVNFALSLMKLLKTIYFISINAHFHMDMHFWYRKAIFGNLAFSLFQTPVILQLLLCALSNSVPVLFAMITPYFIVNNTTLRPILW